MKILVKLLVTIMGVTLIVGAVVGTFMLMINDLIAAGESMVPPPTSVATRPVDQFEWQEESYAVGSIEAVQGVMIRNELSGLVAEIHFESGQTVEAGEPLVELNRETEEAQLAAAVSTQRLASLNLKRARELFEKDTISKAELDLATAEASNASAQVSNLEAIIARRTIYAPFSGRLGIRQIDLGEFLNIGTAIVDLQSEDPVYAAFSLPQRELANLEKGLTVKATTDAAPGIEFIGELTAIESAVDPATRNIRVQATLSNSKGHLKPGMFVNVLVEHKGTRAVDAIPVSSVAYASYGNRVYTAEPAESGNGLIAVQHFVKLGETRGDFIEVIDGIKPDARVVTEGAFKLYPGSPIAPNDSAVPTPSIDPELSDS